MSSVIKKAIIQYVAPQPMPNAIGMDMPAWIRVEWRDELSRRCSRELSLINTEVERIRNFLNNYTFDVKMCYYPAVIGLMPVHIRLQAYDRMDRLHHCLLDLTDEDVKWISELPDDKDINA